LVTPKGLKKNLGNSEGEGGVTIIILRAWGGNTFWKGKGFSKARD